MLEDNSLLGRLRKEIGDQIDKEIEGLIIAPDLRRAGYIRGLQEALKLAEDFIKEINDPKRED